LAGTVAVAVGTVVLVAVGTGVLVSVGGAVAVAVAGTSVAVAGTSVAVAVGGTAVLVGGALVAVAVGGTAVLVGGTEVAVAVAAGWVAVGVGRGLLSSSSPQAASSGSAASRATAVSWRTKSADLRMEPPEKTRASNPEPVPPRVVKSNTDQYGSRHAMNGGCLSQTTLWSRVDPA